MKKPRLYSYLCMMLVLIVTTIPCHGSGFGGGSGSGTASFPDQTGQSGKYLKSTGTAGAEAWDSPAIADGNDTEINRLIDADHADSNATTAGTRTDQSVTPAGAKAAYQPLAAALTSLSGLAETAGGIPYGTADNTYGWLAAGAANEILVGGGAAAPVWTSATGTGAPVLATSPTLITPNIGAAIGTSLSIGGGNATIDNHGAATFRSASYIRDAENPFCQQFYAGTNYDDNYTEFCAPPTGYSETYRLYWPTSAPTGNQVMVFPAPTLGVSQGTWGSASGTGDLISTNNLSDVANAATARTNLDAAQAGTMTDTKWCAFATADGINCTQDAPAAAAHTHTSMEPIVNIALRGGGSAISTGSAGNKRIAAAATITGYTITSSASCSMTVDLWKTTYAAYDVSTHPVDGDSITASAPITLTTAVKAKDETLTGWTKTLSADDIIHVNVDSADCTGDVDIQVYGTRSL